MLLLVSYNLLYRHWLSFHSSHMPQSSFLQLFAPVLSLAPALRLIPSFSSVHLSELFIHHAVWCCRRRSHASVTPWRLILLISLMILSLSTILLLMRFLVYCQIILLDHQFHEKDWFCPVNLAITS